jgi:archaellum component FlaC
VLETYPAAKSFDELAFNCGLFQFDNPSEEGVLICSPEDLGIPDKEIPIKESQYAEMFEVIKYVPTIETVVSKTRRKKKIIDAPLTGEVIIYPTREIYNTDVVRDVLNDFVPLFGNIQLFVPHGAEKVAPKKVKDGIAIQIYCCPSKSERSIVTTPVFGLKLGCKDSYSTSSFFGVPIYSDNFNEEVIAEFYKNNLYIYDDIVHVCTKNDMKILHKLLEKCHMIMTLSKEGLKEYLSSVFERQFMSAMTDNLRKQIEDAKITIDTCESNAKHYLAEYEQYINKINNNKELLNCLSEKISSLSSESTQEEINSINTLEHVESVIMSSESIVVKTDVLCCTHPVTGTIYEIGEFRITIPLKESVTNIKWINLTRTIDGITNTQYAPHVFNESGTACLGSAQPIMADLKAKYEIKALIAICIQFIESVNITDAAGKYLTKFPVYKAGEKEAKTEETEHPF